MSYAGAVFSEPAVVRTPSLDHATSLRDETLLRGVPVSKLLTGKTLLSDSMGTTDSYRLSRQVKDIDVFISHNWTSCSAQKYKVLALFFNLRPATYTVAVYALVLFFATALGVVPLFEMKAKEDKGDEHPFGAYCVLFGPVLFWTVLFRFHHLGKMGTMGSEKVAFLDKCCIHQTDQARKELGIQSLGAFLRHSNALLIVFSETYLQRLWTVFELASFAALHPSKLPQVVLLQLPDVILMSNLLYWLSNLAYVALHSRVISDALAEHGLGSASSLLQAAFALPAVVILCHRDRRWQLELRRAKESAAGFSVRRVACSDEGDRPFLYENMGRFMRSLGLVEQGAEEGEALELFDALVRRQVPWAVQFSAGRAGIHYHHIMIVFMPGLLMAMDFLAAMVRGGKSWRTLFVLALFFATYLGAILPLMVGLMSWLNQRMLCLRGATGWVVTTAVGVLLGAVSQGSLASVDGLRSKARRSDLHLGIFVSINAGLILLTWFVYRPLHSDAVAHGHQPAESATTSSANTSGSEGSSS